MAYNRPGTFNPDALPAHAEPDQAAQELGRLNLNNTQRKPLTRPEQSRPAQQQTSPVNGNRPSQGATLGAQQAYRPPNQNSQGVNANQNYNQGYKRPSDDRYLQSPPPPADYGQGPRPAAPAKGYQSLNAQLRPQQQAPQRTVPPPDADSAELLSLFRVANTSGTGALTTGELGSALVNADSTQFDPQTIRSLMRMFSNTPAHSPGGPIIVFEEFRNLWRFLAAWRELFERFDEDRSGRISLGEFSNALVAFGYRLSQPFIGLLYSTYNDRGVLRRGSRAGSAEGMSFDLFVQACCSLKRMTDVFKFYDDDRDGYVTLSFEEFLSEILRLQDP